MTGSRIGIIGLGAMGVAFAERFVECGVQPFVYNRSRPAIARITSLGGVAADNPAHLAHLVTTVVTMLPDGDAVESVLSGTDGVLAHARPGLLVIDCSTIDPAVSRALAATAHGLDLRFCDAAVGGLPVDARAGRLSIMYGADEEDRAPVEQALAPLAAMFTYCGAPGSGVTTKLISNLLSNAIHVANLEALVIAERAGLDIDTVLQVLRSTAADNRQLHQRVPQELTDRQHIPGFRIDLAYKDISLGRALAAQHRVEATVLSSARELLAIARERGRGSQSVTALLPTIREIQANPPRAPAAPRRRV